MELCSEGGSLSDKRTDHRRILTAATTASSDTNHFPIPVQLLDLSESGMRVKFPDGAAPTLGTTVKVRLPVTREITIVPSLETRRIDVDHRTIALVVDGPRKLPVESILKAFHEIRARDDAVTLARNQRILADLDEVNQRLRASEAMRVSVLIGTVFATPALLATSAFAALATTIRQTASPPDAWIIACGAGLVIAAALLAGGMLTSLELTRSVNKLRGLAFVLEDRLLKDSTKVYRGLSVARYASHHCGQLQKCGRCQLMKAPEHVKALSKLSPDEARHYMARHKCMAIGFTESSLIKEGGRITFMNAALSSFTNVSGAVYSAFFSIVSLAAILLIAVAAPAFFPQHSLRDALTAECVGLAGGIAWVAIRHHFRHRNYGNETFTKQDKQDGQLVLFLFGIILVVLMAVLILSTASISTAVQSVGLPTLWFVCGAFIGVTGGYFIKEVDKIKNGPHSFTSYLRGWSMLLTHCDPQLGEPEPGAQRGAVTA